MLIVCAEVALVEAELVGGLLGCPSCREVLGPWGHARERVLRCRSGDRLLRPRRARCRGCLGTHVLLPDVVLVAAPGRGVGDRRGDRGERCGRGVSPDRWTARGAGGHGAWLAAPVRVSGLS